MSGNDDTTHANKLIVLKEREALAHKREVLTNFLKTKKTTGDDNLAKCQEEKNEAAAAAAAAAKEEAANTAKAAEEAVTKANAAEIEAATNKVEANALCDAEKLDLKTKAELDAKLADEKRVSEILDLQNQLIEELSKETAFLDSIMTGGNVVVDGLD
jgi:hypothetical protein